jgi:hypothetical protein
MKRQAKPIGAQMVAFGAAGGTVAIMVGSKKFGLRQDHAAWGVAAIGAATAVATRGTLRQIATGAAIAGAFVGMYRWWEARQQPRPPVVETKVEETKPAAPSERDTAPSDYYCADLNAPGQPKLYPLADGTASELSPDEVERLKKIKTRLSNDERTRLARLTEKWTLEEIREANSQIRRLSADGVIAWVRRKLKEADHESRRG